MRPILFTPASLAKILSYDPETGDIRWVEDGAIATIAKGGDQPYLMIRARGVRVIAHRAAVFLKTGAWPQRKVDHRDGNGANNRWTNIRPATDQQNAQNCRPKHDGLKGATWDRSRGRWKAQIMVDGVNVDLGRHHSEKEAAAAYDQAAIKHFGEYARTNP